MSGGGIESRAVQNRNPKTQESEPQQPLSCEIEYSVPRNYLLRSAPSRFFTDDHVVPRRKDVPVGNRSAAAPTARRLVAGHIASWVTSLPAATFIASQPR